MHIKHFHILFMIVCILFSFGFAVWSFNQYRGAPETGLMVVGVMSVVFGLALVYYLTRFIKKFKNGGGPAR